ncbi:MAG: HAMP domain-containing protein, partial [Eubacteriales bacterium]|nr:HAMP domain-containing protein [Eubacteriales bacterium]
MRKKLYLLALGVCLLVTVLSATLISVAVGVVQKNLITRHLTDMAAVMWQGGAGSLEGDALSQMADGWVQQINADGNFYRLTVLKRDGTVLLDTGAGVAPADMESHAARAEVVQALRQGIGTDVRRSATLKQDYLYVAMAKNGADRVVRVSLPLFEMAHTQRVVAAWAAISGLTAMLVAAMVCLPLSAHFTRPLHRLRAATQRISQGDYTLTIDGGSDEIGLLGDDFNRMAAHLNQTMRDERLRKAQLDSILNAVPLGILAVDAQEKVLFANQPARMMLDMAPTP